MEVPLHDDMISRSAPAGKPPPPPTHIVETGEDDARNQGEADVRAPSPRCSNDKPCRDEADETIAADDECSICLELLYKPVVPAACNHRFCALCIHKACLRSRCCPLCRAPFAENVRVNTLTPVPGADERIAALYPKCHARKKMVHESELEALRQALEKMTKDVMLFIMPTNNIESNTHIQLHLFEPRYRYLAARALSSGAKIGWVLEGGGDVGSHGRLCSIVHHRLNTDGTFDVVLHVDELFRTESISTIDIRQQNNQQYPPLYVADITILPEG